MKAQRKRNVAYLLGAGATHAELVELDPDILSKSELEGLLIGDVSARVIEKASRQRKYRASVETVSATSGSPNIELLITLLEASKVHDWAYKTALLKKLVEEDIRRILTTARKRKFYLHRALLELHRQKRVADQEQLVGLLSLNYDDVIDQAYRECYGGPNYCFLLEPATSSSAEPPLLKLHGSFNWANRTIRGRRRTIEIIPLGSTKTYLHAPYGFIWSRALESLIECDTLRVIGCSLSPNDIHLIDLLFKAHIEKGEAFDIEIIGPPSAGDSIRNNYGFFPAVHTLTQIEGHLVPDPSPENPFKTWLKYKGLEMLGATKMRNTTTYLRKLLS